MDHHNVGRVHNLKTEEGVRSDGLDVNWSQLMQLSSVYSFTSVYI